MGSLPVCANWRSFVKFEVLDAEAFAKGPEASSHENRTDDKK